VSHTSKLFPRRFVQFVTGSLTIFNRKRKVYYNKKNLLNSYPILTSHDGDLLNSERTVLFLNKISIT